MNLRKYIIVSIIAVTSATGFAQGLLRGTTKSTVGTNNILAVVEDRVITREEVMREVEPFIPQIKAASRNDFDFNQQVSGYAKEIVQNIIDRELIVKDFRNKGMTIPDSYKETYFDDYLNREFNGDRAELLKLIQSQGKTLKQFREEQEKDIIVGYMRGQKSQTVHEISPQKIKDYYEANKSKWYSPASANLRIISLKSGMTATLQDNKKLAATLAQRIAKGEDFAEIARKYSRDDSSAKGGEWGWFKKGELNPLLDAEVFAAKQGEVTKPIVIGETIYIIKIEETKPEGIQSIDSVREQIEWTIVEQNGKAMYQKWLESLRRKAFIKYFNSQV